jgi:peptidyl-prolyl cis-trans isomerase SurA
MWAIARTRGRLLFLLITCTFVFSTAAQAEVVERILAVVNDDIITKSEVDQMAKAMQGQPGVKLPTGGKELENQLLEALIMQKLAKAEAKRRGITVSDKEVDQAYAEFKKRNSIESDDALGKALAKEGMTIKGLKQQMADQMTQQRLVDIVAAGKAIVSDKEVRDFYDKEFPKIGGGQIHLKVLVMPFPPGASEAQREEIKKKAEIILQEHKKGVSWESMRDKHNVMIQDMGFVSESDLEPELAQFLAKVKTGETTPIQTLNGFQLVQVVDRKDSKTRTFEEVAPEIREMLQRREMDKTFKEWMKGQRDRSHIKIMTDTGSSTK